MKTFRCVQGSAEWHQLRLGKPTASVFERVVTPAKGELSKQADALAYKLAAERILGYPIDGVTTAAMEAGREGEPKARAWYEMAADCDVEQVGICFDDSERIGASPDGLVGSDGLLEIKCPTPQVHVGYLLSGFGVETDYRPQVQGQLWICEREWLDTVSWCPPFVAARRRIVRDEEFIAKLRSAVGQFADKVDEAEAKLLAMGCVSFATRKANERDEALGMTDAEADEFASRLFRQDYA